ncbi:ATP-binding cassette, subfamily B [Desulfotomaculum arcticum]|uniref:ATP-binding cassette, subfamily B n=1 Tax=Desulfotruncus arcticus DSM 17038 TaxID=1121424 RepID=A0A1I2RP46_9FIRM|nr:ABC transporter ATP-binding protein [Desulfotruncus arcticus]SFG41249.1 ATP-binding cassette, subfamily B [Desulfotomaculum arcticum] [Desulfotruncus arcticus DSM 17038]
MIKLLRFLKPFAWSVAAVLVLVLLQSLADLYLPTLMSDIVDIGIVNGDNQYVLRIGGLMLLFAAGSALCMITASFLSSRVATGLGRNLRSMVFSRVESYSLHEFDQLGTASLITRTTNDITQIQQVLVVMMRMMVSAPMMSIGGIIMAVSKDAVLSLVFVVVLPVLAGTILLIFRKGVPLFKAMQVNLDKLNRVVREGLTGIRVVRAFNRLDHERERFLAANSDLTGTAIKVNKLMAVLMPVMMLVMNLSTIAIVWFGGIRVDHGDMQVGDMMAFLQYAMQIMFSLIMISFMFIMLPRAEASAVRINEVLDIVPEIKDAEKVKHAAGQRGFVEFKNVTFSYPGAEQPAISNISFTAGPGEVTAIIGGTGSGKSTLINLIPRFYDIDRGSILIDGVDVREMSQAGLRAKIGLVPQNAVLFTGTIADNIRYGKEDAADEEVRRAAETAQATEFITGMKDGFDSVIAQGGTNVSGGQKQRLAIARALVRRPEIYVFDDALSALDYKTDARLRAALRKETADAAVLIVAQRVSTVMGADRIIVMEEGKIAGIGSHRELLDTCEVYREIVFSQLSGEEIA